MAAVLKADLIQANSQNLEKDISKYDLVGFGSGIYFNKFHRNLLDFINRLPGNKYPKAFVFSTSGAGLKIYNLPLKNKLSKKGFTVIGDFTCRGFDTYGPFKLAGGLAKGRPNEQDLQAAAKFAKKLINEKNEVDSCANTLLLGLHHHLFLPGI